MTILSLSFCLSYSKNFCCKYSEFISVSLKNGEISISEVSISNESSKSSSSSLKNASIFIFIISFKLPLYVLFFEISSAFSSFKEKEFLSSLIFFILYSRDFLLI